MASIAAKSLHQICSGRGGGAGNPRSNEQEKSMAMNDLGEADYERLYRSLRLIRRAEEEIARIYPSDKIKSPVHLSIGQEAVSVGVCDVLRSDDVVAPTYRGHAA